VVAALRDQLGGRGEDPLPPEGVAPPLVWWLLVRWLLVWWLLVWWLLVWWLLVWWLLVWWLLVWWLLARRALLPRLTRPGGPGGGASHPAPCPSRAAGISA
jgi:hypothetical protein